MMLPAIERLVIGFGSESGNAKALALQLSQHPALQTYHPVVQPLGGIELADFCGDAGSGQALIIVSSSFGDGEPPGNAEQFLAQAQQAHELRGLQYAIFGLGDTAYPQFCGFTKQLEQLLQARHAHALMERVDADACYLEFFQRWLPALQAVLQGNSQAGQALGLQVCAYAEDAAFEAPLLALEPLSSSQPAAYHVRLDVQGSGMAWRAGDTLYVLPENTPDILQAIGQWYGAPEVALALRTKELRQLSKTVLRELQRLSQNEALKELLKFSQREALQTYLWGADLLDVLQDFCTPEQVPIEELLAIVSPCLPRAYSIASAGNGRYMDLCIREIAYEKGARPRWGTATHWLLSQPQTVRVYCRSNPNFHLTADAQAPLILIGTGTGIAPLMGLLREMQTGPIHRETCLIFGERSSTHDWLYRQELQAMQHEGLLSHCITAFSRDQAQKYYVQDAIAAQSPLLLRLLAQGAHVYVCGNKRHLERSIGQAMDALTAPTAQPQDCDAPDNAIDKPTTWEQLTQEKRVHLELY